MRVPEEAVLEYCYYIQYIYMTQAPDKSQTGQGPESKKPAYLAGLVARFFFALGVNGVGGVASKRRSTSSVLGCAGSRFFCAVGMGV